MDRCSGAVIFTYSSVSRIKNEKIPEISKKKMAKRIVLPFAIIQIVIFVTLALFSENDVCMLLNIRVLTEGGGTALFPIIFGYIFNLRSFCNRHFLI